jgi:hypothetical protein
MLRSMVRAKSGREYRTQELRNEKNEVESYWTCLECGALVGPLVRHRDTHDAWHSRLARS